MLSSRPLPIITMLLFMSMTWIFSINIKLSLCNPRIHICGFNQPWMENRILCLWRESQVCEDQFIYGFLSVWWVSATITPIPCVIQRSIVLWYIYCCSDFLCLLGSVVMSFIFQEIHLFYIYQNLDIKLLTVLFFILLILYHLRWQCIFNSWYWWFVIFFLISLAKRLFLMVFSKNQL